MTATLITRPPSRTFIVNASAATNVNGPASQRAFAEVADQLVEVAGHHRDLGLREPGDPQGLHQPVHPPGGDPEQVAGRDHRGQCRLGPAAALQQPLGEVGALAQLGDRDVQGADPGVQVAVPVAVAAVGPRLVAGTVGGTTHAVGIGGEQRVDERPASARAADPGWPGPGARAGTRQGRYWVSRSSRCSSLRVGFGRSLEESRGDRTYVYDRARSPRRTPLCWTQLLGRPRLRGARSHRHWRHYQTFRVTKSESLGEPMAFARSRAGLPRSSPEQRRGWTVPAPPQAAADPTTRAWACGGRSGAGWRAKFRRAVATGGVPSAQHGKAATAPRRPWPDSTRRRAGPGTPRTPAGDRPARSARTGPASR